MELLGLRDLLRFPAGLLTLRASSPCAVQALHRCLPLLFSSLLCLLLDNCWCWELLGCDVPKPSGRRTKDLGSLVYEISLA